uniref:Myosin XVB n=1 Tax=Catharus ustulatus TaxID=91951 RepID=A0A8C3UIQ3_CATUS
CSLGRRITETQPPEVKVKDDLSLPPTINSYPFSSFVRSHFQKPDFPAPGQPLQQPLTHLDAEHQESALEINKLVLRFIGDKSLHGWQEVLLGNYIAGRGLSDAALRDEIFSQVVSQTWRNPDTEHSQRGWVLMATLLSCLSPSPALQKPLLKFVSDHGMEGYSAVCQRKMLTAAECTETEPAACRAYPPTQLEWTANQRRGKMVLDVHTFNEEKFSAEVESWMTGEQYAACILSARGCDKKTRGWSVSMFTGNTWQDLLGCDFVLDLIGEMEETSNFSSPSQAPTEYPITPERDRSTLPVCCVLLWLVHVESTTNVSILIWDSPKHCAFGFLPLGFSGMAQTPVYQPMPSMMGMPAAMPMMPGAGGIAPMPAMVMPQPMVPAVDPSQLAAQQQAFINQQAMLMAQQMTLQAMSISQQQQQELQKQQKSLENSRPRFSRPAQASAPATLPKPKKPPSSQAAAASSNSPDSSGFGLNFVFAVCSVSICVWFVLTGDTETFQTLPAGDFSCVFAGLLMKAVTKIAPASPLPPPEPKPKNETPKPRKEPPVVKPSGPESRPAPSREIGNIIKMYQSRPAPEPLPVQPVRKVAKPFVKKSDPKNEALAKLGMMKASPQPPVSSLLSGYFRSFGPSLLVLLFTFTVSSPCLSLEMNSLLPGSRDCKTSLGSCYCNICNTTLTLLLQVFYPKENFSHPYSLNLLCEQIIRDTFSESSFRISREEKRKMKDLLIGNNARSIRGDGIKKRIVVAARDNWANYFSRLFPVQGEKGSDVQILGVSHRGMRLLKVEKAAGYHPEHLKILRSYCFADVLSVEMRSSNSLEFSLKTEQLILHSPKAPSIKAMVELFMQELRQDSNYVVALRSYVVDDKSLLSFKKGDLIELLPMEGVEPGWQFGCTAGRCGLFPISLVQLAPAPDYLSSSMDRRGEQRKSLRTSPGSRNTSREVSSAGRTWLGSVGAARNTAWALGWLHMSSASLVTAEKFSGHFQPLAEPPLLRLKARLCLAALMRFMGDQPKHKHQNEVQCIYEILQVCRVPQGNNGNGGQRPCWGGKDEMRGWLLLNLLTGYFLPSKTLMPYATKFLQLASSDPSSNIAKICESNLRKNFLYGGRRHLPFAVEMEALLKGHGARRLVVLMPGGMEYLTRIRTFTVAKELLQEICEQMGIGEQQEIQDFVLFAVRSDDKNHGKWRPLVTVTLRRLIWRAPLHFDSQVYTDVHYGQVLWDYLNGRILLSQGEQMEIQVGLLAMFQHWAKGEQQNSAPSRYKILGPLAALTTPGWCSKLLAESCCPQPTFCFFLEHVMKLPFFGYTIFVVERISDEMVPVPCFFGVNKEEIIVVDGTSQEVSRAVPLQELQKMRTLRPISDGGLPGLELHYGSPDSPRAMWVELPQVRSACTCSFLLLS